MYYLIFYDVAVVFVLLFFFFSSRRRHTRLTCDWSSDVCSSDLALHVELVETGAEHVGVPVRGLHRVEQAVVAERVEGRDDEVGTPARADRTRSEERRVGKEWRAR